jgi:hypothetical protein
MPRRRKRRLARAARVLRARVDAPRPALVADDAELRRQDDVVAAIRDRRAHELLVLAAAVHVGGVQQRDPERQRAVDRLDRLVVVGRTVELGHAHAAEAEGRDLEAVAAEGAVVHGFSLLI